MPWLSIPPELALAPGVKPSPNKELFIKASDAPASICFCLPSSGLGVSQSCQHSPAHPPPGSPGPPKLLPGKQGTPSASPGRLCLSSLNPQQLFGNGNHSSVRLWKGGRNALDQVRQSPPAPLAFLEFHRPQPDLCVLSPHCAPRISELWSWLCSFSSVSSQFHRNPIITVPVSGMSQSRGGDRFAGRSPTSVPGPGRAHKTAVFLFFCHVEAAQGWSSSRMKHEL